MTNTQTHQPLPEPKVLTVLEAVNILKGLAQQRAKANLLYKQNEKSNVAEQVTFRLAEIPMLMDPVQIAYAVLKLERRLIYIAPRTSEKIFNTYFDKVEEVLAGMREMVVFIKSKQPVN